MNSHTPDNLSVLFFSRGRGHGHAIPDMDIASELTSLDSSIRMQFVSYAASVEAFKKRGFPVIDMEIPENNMFLNTLEKAFRLITEHKPQVVVAHEEFAAVAAAKLANVPTVFVSSWLPFPNTIYIESLMTASGILVLENPGIFPVLPPMRGRVAYAGPTTRKLQYTRRDRPQLRKEMGIADDAFAILVMQGGWADEERASMIDTVLSAFFSLKRQPKHLLWLAEEDAAKLTLRTKGMKGIQILSHVDPVERAMAACDVVITKGTRSVTLDAAGAGVPSISISTGAYPVDDIVVPRIRTNIALNAGAVDAVMLRQYIEKAAASPKTESIAADSTGNTGVAAKHLLEMLRRAIAEQTTLQEILKTKTP